MAPGIKLELAIKDKIELKLKDEKEIELFKRLLWVPSTRMQQMLKTQMLETQMLKKNLELSY